MPKEEDKTYRCKKPAKKPLARKSAILRRKTRQKHNKNEHPDAESSPATSSNGWDCEQPVTSIEIEDPPSPYTAWTNQETRNPSPVRDPSYTFNTAMNPPFFPTRPNTPWFDDTLYGFGQPIDATNRQVDSAFASWDPPRNQSSNILCAPLRPSSIPSSNINVNQPAPSLNTSQVPSGESAEPGPRRLLLAYLNRPKRSI